MMSKASVLYLSILSDPGIALCVLCSVFVHEAQKQTSEDALCVSITDHISKICVFLDALNVRFVNMDIGGLETLLSSAEYKRQALNLLA